jgi:PAS domain S-box-containing protein
MGALLRSIDWSSTAVGPVRSWPQSLRTALSILLETGFPMYIAWGPEFTQFYNDGYRPILGSTKHPAAMGRSTRQTFAEIWHIIGPMFQGVMEGTATTVVDFLLPLDRHGFVEECYFIFSYSPIREEGGAVGGVLVTVTETTERILGARRLKTLQDLSARTQAATTAEVACEAAAEILGENPADLPFALLYLFHPDGKRATLAGVARIESGTAASPTELDLTAEGSPWPLAAIRAIAESVESGAVQLSEELPPSLGPLPAAPGQAPPQRVLVLPIAQPGADRPTGALVAALSPGLILDEKYRSFLALVAGQIAIAISNARALLEARARAEALAEIDRAKTAFFSNVSHELRTPLTLLLGLTEEALADGTAPLQATERQRMEVLHRNGLRLLKLVNTLLEFSRIEAGRLQAAYEPTDLGHLTRDLASVFRAAIESAGLRFVLAVETLDEPVFVDPEMWEKIVLNLLSNALKFTFEGEIEVALRRSGDRALLTVRDTGTGIAAEQLPLLFDRFHRVPGARSRTHEGTGIGLALVQELVKLQGGTVTVSSIPGQGTTFSVALPFGTAHLAPERITASRTLPATANAVPFVQETERWAQNGAPGVPLAPLAATAEPPATARAPGTIGPARILVADDNADMREYVGRLLGDRWAVEAVADGAAALERARQTLPDLILSDVMMPGLDGYQLLQALRADERTRGIPVLFLSARAGEESRIEGLQAGADDYLVKPFSARELLARVGTHLEISRLRTAADRNRARLHSQFLQAPVAVCLLSGPELVFELANPLYEEMVGRSNITGKPIRAVFPELPPDAPIFRTLEEVYRSGEPFMAEEYPVPLDRQGSGTPVDVFFKFTAQPMRDASGEVSGVMAVAVDVTVQVHARREVEAARQLLEAVVDQMPSGVIIAEAPSGRMLLANERVRAILGHPALPTRSIDDFGAYTAVHPDGRPFVAGDYALIRALGGEVVLDEEILYLHADGKERVLSASAAPVYDQEGRILAAVNSFSDITERKRAEVQHQQLFLREREARAEAEQASRLKDEFLATLSHELRTPLNAILGWSQLLRKRHARGEDVGEGLAVIERNSWVQERLIEDLLDMSRIISGKLRIDVQRVDLATVVQAAVESALPAAEAREIRLQTVLDPRAGPIRGDSARLQQVVWNLLMNAIKFTPKGGKVQVALERVNSHLEITVTDTGQGISPEFLPHVFDRFRQADSTTARRHGGLGIGLSIVKSLVELHGGSVRAKSPGEGRGSTFCVELPLMVMHETGEESKREHPEHSPRTDSAALLREERVLEGLSVLVVDDDKDARDLLGRLLEDCHARVLLAASADEGFALLQQERPDVLLSDIGMPGQDGYEFIRRVRELPAERGGATPAAALTAFARSEDRRRALVAGYQTHVAKPVESAELVAIVASLAGRMGRPRA